jgi:hypothetical protein
MNTDPDAVTLLREIRDLQRQSLETQQAQRAAFDAYLTESRQQVEQSLELQRAALGRARQAARFVIPLVIVLMVLLGWLLLRWRVLF